MSQLSPIELPDTLRDSVELAYLSGSREAGLDHASSDSDLHVVLKPGIEHFDRRVDAGGHSLQLTFEDPARLERVLRDSNSFEPTPTARDAYSWWFETERSAYRLFHSTVVFASPYWQAHLATAWRERVPQAFMGSWATRAARFAEDFDGMMRGEDVSPHELMYVASQSFFNSANVALASLGDVYVSEKFLARRLQRRMELANLLPTIEALLHTSTVPLTRRARALHSLGQFLVAYSLLENWNGELRCVEKSYPMPDLSRQLMAPGFGLVRYHDSWSLAGVPKSYRVDTSGARAWLRLAPPIGSESLSPESVDRFRALGLVAQPPLHTDDTVIA